VLAAGAAFNSVRPRRGKVRGYSALSRLPLARGARCFTFCKHNNPPPLRTNWASSYAEQIIHLNSTPTHRSFPLLFAFGMNSRAMWTEDGFCSRTAHLPRNPGINTHLTRPLMRTCPRGSRIFVTWNENGTQGGGGGWVGSDSQRIPNAC
jgi:hypothetical protein